jgi:plasmid maintenance system antidote protein VapI
MDPYRMANEAAHRTRYSVCASGALVNDWEPLMIWMAEVTMTIGAGIAVEIWFEIQKKVDVEEVERDEGREPSVTHLFILM